MSKLAAISIDVDEVACYESIHGLQPGPQEAQHAVFDRCLPRLVSLCGEFNIRATFFVIGATLGRKENRETVARLHEAGHEIANHSHNHLYDLTRRPKAEMASEVARCSDAIQSATGTRPSGFRAPGYTVTDELFSVLQDQGVRYDSSVFPCPSYYSAKLATLGAMRIGKRQSHSVADTPHVLRASRAPYRVGRPYWKRGGGIVELPIGVTGRLSGSLPFIGTSLVLAGRLGSRWLTRRMLGQPFVNLELHGIDAADARRDGLNYLKAHQPDLRVPVAAKLTALRMAIQTLRDDGYQFVPLAEAASRLAPSR